MIRLTYLHWSDGKRGAMLLNPSTALAITPSERDGIAFSQIHVQGYTFSVAETIEQIEALIRDQSFNGHTIDAQDTRALSSDHRQESK